jgi:hypothetical protein
MLLMRCIRNTSFILTASALFGLFSASAQAQAALLMEEPYGFFGTLNPTGHNAIYFERICAETPVKLRRCEAGEMGAVIARYQGIAGYDWVAVPLMPYLYSVEEGQDVPAHVDREAVTRLRNRYYEAHLMDLGGNLPAGSILHGGWTQLVGVAYERRTYAFRFATTEEQDDELIARMNTAENHSQFDLLYSNCADFARIILNSYYPGGFKRSIFPDAGMTTPKQIGWKLVRYAAKHPAMKLAVFEIPQVPGYRRLSHSNKSVSESLSTTAYAVPIALVNPYLAGGIFVDYLVRGRHKIIPKHPQLLSPENLAPLTLPALTALSHAPENPESAGAEAPSDTGDTPADAQPAQPTHFGLREIKATHE